MLYWLHVGTENWGSCLKRGKERQYRKEEWYTFILLEYLETPRFILCSIIPTFIFVCGLIKIIAYGLTSSKKDSRGSLGYVLHDKNNFQDFNKYIESILMTAFE